MHSSTAAPLNFAENRKSNGKGRVMYDVEKADATFGGKNLTIPRHELKFVISPEKYYILSRRMASLLPRDEYNVNDDGYFISSVYFDDAFDSAYYEKLSGGDERKKYRIRTYNHSLSVIKLECKSKRRGMTYKSSESISASDFENLCAGNFRELPEDKPLAQKLCALSRSVLLSPKVTVDYTREAYCHPLSKTRITFDKNLSAGVTSQAVPEHSFKAFPYAEFRDPESVILEVKYDKYFPEFLRSALNESLSAVSASKYVICRDRLRSAGVFFN